MKDRMYIGLIGIGLSVLGWIALNGEHFPWVYRIVAPRYYDGMTALKELSGKQAVLNRGDPGFAELAGILKGLVGRQGNVEIVSIKNLGAVRDPAKPAEGVRGIAPLSLEIHFQGLPQEIWEIGALQTAVKRKYPPLNLFLWGSLILGIGLLLNLMSLVMKD